MQVRGRARGGALLGPAVQEGGELRATLSPAETTSFRYCRVAAKCGVGVLCLNLLLAGHAWLTPLRCALLGLPPGAEAWLLPGVALLKCYTSADFASLRNPGIQASLTSSPCHNGHPVAASADAAISTMCTRRPGRCQKLPGSCTLYQGYCAFEKQPEGTPCLGGVCDAHGQCVSAGELGGLAGLHA